MTKTHKFVINPDLPEEQEGNALEISWDEDSNWKKVLMGYDNHVIAIKTNGTLWAWGFNNKSQLGTGNTTRRNTPIQIGTDTNWVDIAVGYEFTLALKSNGTLWAWISVD